MKIADMETHVRRASHLAHALFLLTRSDVDFSDERDRCALDALADEIAAHASAAEHLLDAPALN
ncbi:hypothetical protein IY145_17835 [Methylosinus sp. H3A]|uniref:hypothetical protein n=1 Tax=Methylosinus sp. H3A TaxID=2785786 RepID=UPI0018C2A7F2|nr:hypothetical protein [Methylosinus sp. H3A]MBG0811219.1 hypothetical protein [Methylosinus sp. H3A]